MQHCKTGAKIVNSSWNAFPKPRPWSQCNVNVSLPNTLCECVCGCENCWNWDIVRFSAYSVRVSDVRAQNGTRNGRKTNNFDINITIIINSKYNASSMCTQMCAHCMIARLCVCVSCMCTLDFRNRKRWYDSNLNINSIFDNETHTSKFAHDHRRHQFECVCAW